MAPRSGNDGTQPVVTDFVHFLASEGHVETLISEHVRAVSGACASCAKPWPCNWRRLADQALELLQWGSDAG